jgi:hypothetical protein
MYQHVVAQKGIGKLADSTTNEDRTQRQRSIQRVNCGEEGKGGNYYAIDGIH